MRTNVLRQLLNEGKPSICARVNTVWPDIVELIGLTGAYDYVEFAAEYGPFTLHDLDNFCRAAELYGMGTMIKLDQDPRLYLAQRAIGSGFQSILFVDCRTVEEVRHCVRICRPDTPEDGGLFGAAARRFAYDSSGHEEFSQALRDIVVAIMVEKKVLVDNLEEVLAVPGLDMVQWGPSDYTMSSGLKRGDPAVKEAERYVIETALKMGVQPRVELNNLEGVEYYLDLGVKHFRIGTDMGILRAFWKQNGEALRKMLS
ncbi:MAG: 2,4-dihydroxyhept-2-ene-1,7-dioic acid aldolase [Chloroflexi bacterium]|nr:2,4-dihydroxyhept-2-ene-1,7-dioic acid aldolase [Chloroflexota bacterium]